jgi:predicted transcriptional regulator
MGSFGATRAEIRYNAFVSHEQLKQYIILHTENDLPYYDKAMHTFKTTEKRLLLLQAYGQIDQILKEQHC